MALGKFLDRPLLKDLRDAAATIRAAIFFGAPIVSVLVIVYLSWGARLLPPNLAIGVVLILSIAAILGSWSAYSVWITRPGNAYEITSMESTLLIEALSGHHRYTSTKDMVIKARRHGIRLIDQRWYWTGQSSSSYDVQSSFTDHVIFNGGHPEPDHWTYRWVYLGRALTKGETARVKVVLTIEDDVHPMRPFFSEGGKGYRTKCLKLVLRFPQAEVPTSVENQVWTKGVEQGRLVTETPLSPSIDPKDSLVTYVISVDRPKRNRRYGFRWQW